MKQNVKKHCEYFKYVARHKWYVMCECFKWGLIWQGIIHDCTKLAPREWFAYADKFYGGNTLDTNKVSKAFTKAWISHQKNKHHWQAHISIDEYGKLKVMEMPDKYIVEMVCDWIGASKAQGNKSTPLEWYESERDRMVLHEATRKKVDEIIGYKF